MRDSFGAFFERLVLPTLALSFIYVALIARMTRASMLNVLGEDYVRTARAKGIGEIGITGTAAAIGNAIYHATGRRIRDLPITPAKLLAS